MADRVGLVTAASSEPRSAWWRGSTQRQTGASGMAGLGADHGEDVMEGNTLVAA